jgi:periplasmic protein TonB
VAARADIFAEHESWRGPLGISFLGHGLLLATIVVVTVLQHRNSWGGGGGIQGAINASLVSTIPLPAQTAPQENIVATPNPGLVKPQPKQVEETPEALPIPDRTAKKKPAERTQEKQRPEPQQPPQNNEVPYGKGEAANSLRFNLNNGGNGSITTQGTGGDFQARYGWYVRQVQEKIATTWYQYQISPNVPRGTKVTVSFDITRDGRPTNINVTEPSGNSVLDMEALYTLKRIDAFPNLPPDYSGRSVHVDFYFER